MANLKIEIKWAVIFAIVSILWLALERLLGWHDTLIEQHAILTNLFAIVAILIYVLALQDKRNNYYGGLMTWKQGFIAGCLMSVFIAILTPLTMYISINYVVPDYFPNMIEYAVDSGNASREEAEATFNLTSYILQSAIFALVVGVVTSAVVAIFVRKKPASHVV